MTESHRSLSIPIHQSVCRNSPESVLINKRSFSRDHVLEILKHSPHLVTFASGLNSNNKINAEEDDEAVQIRIGNWFVYKLRDRSTDGPNKPQAPLTSWPYDKIEDIPKSASVEESIYWLNPHDPLTDRFDYHQSHFIINPFEEIPFSNPTEANLNNWTQMFQRLIHNSELPLPGSFTRTNIPGIRKDILHASKKILHEQGYEYLTAVPTWWHISQMYEHLGFNYENLDDHDQINKIRKALHEKMILFPSLDNLGEKHTRTIESWLMVYQFWANLAEENGSIPEQLSGTDQYILRDMNGTIITYPLTPKHNLWMNIKT